MNPNRQNNRFTGSGCGNCSGQRAVIGASCATPVQGGCGAVVNNCSNPCGGVIGVASDRNDSCDGGILIGNIVIGQNCSDCNQETSLMGMPVAMAYVPWQSYGNIYSMQRALNRGTIFQELDLDFAGRRCN